MSGDGKVSYGPLVCVVDDDSLMRDSTVRLIRSFGFRAEAFASAQQFDNSGHRENTACLILDVRMPGMSGIELQRELVASHRAIPVILITAHEDEGLRVQGLRDGAVAFLVKPFSEESLLQAVRSALAER
jgi:FixJ family two-component response regulator